MIINVKIFEKNNKGEKVVLVEEINGFYWTVDVKGDYVVKKSGSLVSFFPKNC